MEAPRNDPTNPPLKQARAILYIRPGHFENIQSFSKQLDLSILGNQPRKEELMNGSSRFAGHRIGLEFCKGLAGSIDQHLDILELETGIDIEHGLEKAGDRVAAFVLWRKSERRRYGTSKAPSSANISAALFGSLNEKAVYSSMSSLALFIDILLFLIIS